MTRIFLHYGIHFLLPIIVGLLFYKGYRLKVILILLAGILIDVDHLLATPIFDAQRCSINFHPLHTYWAITAYLFLTIYRRTRLLGLALMIHIFADFADCFMMK